MTLTKPYEATFQVGDGETKDFPFYFDEVSENFIKVIIKRADGSIYYPTFSVDMELLRVVFGEDEITPTADDVICIYRDTPTIQDTQFNTLQGYNAKALENILSKIVAMIQEMKANGFSTQILQGEPWSLDLMKPADNGASVQIDYQARVLKKGLYFKMSDGNLLASTDGVNFVQMPKSENVAEFRQYTDDEGNVHFEYRVGDKWFGLATGTDISSFKKEIDNKFVVIDAQIDANADAIQKTREDFINADSEIHQILNNHAENLTTLRGNQASLGGQVSGIEEKIPGDASATNQLATKADLANVDLDGYVKKSGDTMTGDLVLDVVNRADIVFQDSTVDTAGNTNSYRKLITAPHQTQGLIFSEAKNGTVNMQFSMIADGFFMPRGNRLLGSSDYPWENIYAKKLNNGADVAIPTEGGTLARIEDLIDLRADINEADSELQTQITAQAAEIATKQDQLVAGDNIVISGNTISATGAGGGVGFDMQVVDQLPATGKKGVIYLVPKDGSAPDVHDEYVWIDATQTFELIGTTQVDLTDYATKEELGGYLPTTGGALTGDLSLDDHKLNFKGGVSVLGNGNIGGIWVSYYNNNIAISAYTRTLSGIQKLNNGADIAIPTTGGTLARLEDITDINNNSINTKELTVGTSEGTLNLSITAGVATIATNNGLDIVAQTKFDTAPTTDDNTTYANALDTSLVRKAQVATAISDVLTSVEGELTDIVEYIDKEDLAIKNDQTQLNKNINTVADWVNAKDSEGNRATLETEAQDAYRAINELNAKIGTGAGTKVIIKRYS